MKKWKEFYRKDLSRYRKNEITIQIKSFLKLFRKCQFPSNGISLFFNQLLFRRAKRKLKIELFSKTSIGPGLYLGHPFGITINHNALIGSNCNIHKNVTIGQENRGKRKGSPIIGNNVWIGIGAVVVGNISIGDNVLIAANSFVNCDIPSNSVVFGNPCMIKHKNNATEDYINNKAY